MNLFPDSELSGMGFKTGANLEDFVWAVLSHSVPILCRQGVIHD